ncbi:MAG: deoxyribodipyrimidine photo-lyase [Rhodospirillaceae bacterium]
MTAIVWFRDDLRLFDHAALAAAGRAAPAFVLDAGFSSLGGASKWWLHHALAALGNDIAARGGRLTLARGEAGAALAEIAAAAGADAVHAHAARIPAERALQEEAGRVLAAHGVRLVLHAGALLHDPAALRSGAGTPYAVFTPFWRAFAAREEAWLAAPAAAEPVFAPGPQGLALEDLGLLPRHPWAEKLAAHWRVGEAAAERRLEDFVAEGLADYARDRDRPDLPATSRLSPYLRWGQLSPQRAWRRVRAAMDADPALQRGGWAFLRQLAWREFAHHVLAAHPQMARENLKPAFDAFPWAEDGAAFARWTRGETGYPLVDAAMRELWATGWMHNRGRMVAASFLVKHLRCDWRAGLAWFDDALVDADPALDPFGWQWVAGSGADAAPYFRIFNPTLQAQKFDPDGAYRARWGADAGPPPMVEHGAARAAALAAYRSLAKNSHS